MYGEAVGNPMLFEPQGQSSEAEGQIEQEREKYVPKGLCMLELSHQTARESSGHAKVAQVFSSAYKNLTDLSSMIVSMTMSSLESFELPAWKPYMLQYHGQRAVACGSTLLLRPVLPGNTLAVHCTTGLRKHMVN